MNRPKMNSSLAFLLIASVLYNHTVRRLNVKTTFSSMMLRLSSSWLLVRLLLLALSVVPLVTCSPRTVDSDRTTASTRRRSAMEMAANGDTASVVPNLTFGLINGHNAFFDIVQAGFEARCAQYGVTCHVRSNGGPEACPLRLEYLQELNTALQVDAIALKPCLVNVTVQLLEQNHNGTYRNDPLPIVTFDSDVPAEFHHLRLANVGTNNWFMGRTMAKVLRQLRPEAGYYVILGRKDERMDAFRQEISRVIDEGGQEELFHGAWTELEPDLHFSGLSYMEQMEEYASRTPAPDAMVAITQSPMRQENWTQFVDDHPEITFVGSDGSDFQLDYLSQGHVHGLVGQLPYQMGATAFDVLYEQAVTNRPPKDDFIYTHVVAHNLIPLELPSLTVDTQRISAHGLQAVGFTFFTTIGLLTSLCLAWTYRHRQQAVVRAAQPFFLAMISIGVFIMATALIPLSFDDHGQEGSLSEFESTAICMSVPWLAFTGFTMVFSALFSKTWRVNQLFGSNKPYSRVRVEERDVLIPFCGLVLANIAILTCWTILDPLRYVRVDNLGTDYWNRVLSSYGGCRSEDNAMAYLAPLAVLNVSVVMIACWQAHRARDIQSEFSESRYIGLTVFSLLQGLLTGIPVITVVRDMPEAFYLLVTFTVFGLCMAILGLIFIPKMIMQRQYAKMPESEQRKEILAKIRESAGATNLNGSANTHTNSGQMNFSSGVAEASSDGLQQRQQQQQSIQQQQQKVGNHQHEHVPPTNTQPNQSEPLPEISEVPDSSK